MWTNQSPHHGYWILAAARNCGKEYMLPYLTRLSIVVACLCFLAACVNAQCDCVEEPDFVEIELSEGHECVSDCFAPCNAFELSSKGVTPHFCYEAVDFLRETKHQIKVELVDAISLELIKVRHRERKVEKWSWTSKTGGEYLRVTEQWDWEPITPHDGYRLRWKVGDNYVYSEVFEIHG